MEHFRAKSEELTSNTSGDNHLTLLRQVEVLQAQHDIATENWSGIESSLQSRIANLEQEADDNASREAYLRKKVKTLTESVKMQATENEALNDQLDELKSQLAKLHTTHAQTTKELFDSKSLAAESESAAEKQKAEFEKKLASVEEKLKIAVDALQLQQQQQQHHQQQSRTPVIDRKKSVNGPDQILGDPISRSGSSSPFSQRFNPEDGFGIRTPSAGLNGRRMSSKTSLMSFHGSQGMDNSVNSSSSAFSLSLETNGHDNQLPTHAEDDDSFISPYAPNYESFPLGGGAGSASGTGRDRRGDEASSRFDNNSVSTVGAGPSIQLVNRMSRTIRSLESELSNLKVDLTRMTASKDEAVKDITRLMQETEALNAQRAQIQEMESKIQEMSIREQTALEMLGEKSEQVQELRADVDDIKSMFKQQIEELVDRLALQEKR